MLNVRIKYSMHDVMWDVVVVNSRALSCDMHKISVYDKIEIENVLA